MGCGCVDTAAVCCCGDVIRDGVWGGMGWNDMGWVDMGWDRMGYGMGWDMGRDGMGRDMEWDVGWDGYLCLP